MNRRTLILALCFALSFSFLPVETQARKLNSLETDTIRDYEKRIKALNLFNGLYLSGDQIDEILDILYDLEDISTDFERNLSSELLYLVNAYADLESDLIDDDIVDRENQRAASEQKRKVDQIVTEHRQELSGLNRQLTEVFSDKQIKIIDDYKPCIIPPVSENNISIGQTDGANRHAIQKLERMRKLPRWQFENMLSKHIAETLRHIEIKSGIYDENERELEINRIVDLAWEVYEMDELEFEINKNELASELKPLLPQSVRNREKRIKEKTSYENKDKVKRKYDLDKAGLIFLDTTLIDIFETKLQLAYNK